jgi:hypothetical protein
MTHHPSYKEVWETVLPLTRDPEVARHEYEPGFAGRDDYIERYRFNNAFHPVHGIMALYPLKRLRHAAEVIVAAPEDPTVPEHIGFRAAPTMETAIAMAQETHGPGASIALVENPLAFNRT